MPRAKRLELPGVAQHVIQRGNDRQACFFETADYLCYLQALREAVLRYACQVHAYVLMTNHVHLLLTPADAGAVAKVMQAVGRRYVRHVNDSTGRTGTLWEGRYKASLVGSPFLDPFPLALVADFSSLLRAANAAVNVKNLFAKR